MDAPFRVERAGPADLPRLAPLFDAYRVFYRQPSDPAGAEAFLRDRLAKGDSVVFLALDGERALGFAQLYPSFSSTRMRRLWVLNDLYVDPGARGRGVARALLDRARRHAVETDARGLVLETEPDNLAAQRLYEATGWTRDGNAHYRLWV